MKKIAIAAALLMMSASAHAGTYSYEGVTVHVKDGCRSSACVSVYAPGYASYNGGRSAKIRRLHKDNSRFASRKEDDMPVPAAEVAPAKTQEAAPQPLPSDAPPAK
jgi:hypothetical protein